MNVSLSIELRLWKVTGDGDMIFCDSLFACDTISKGKSTEQLTPLCPFIVSTLISRANID